MLTPKHFRQTNQLLARLIHDPDTPEAMRQAAKNARRSLFRYQYGAGTRLAPTAHCPDDQQRAA
jgi:uncharacterized protein (UPF0147 family)